MSNTSLTVAVIGFTQQEYQTLGRFFALVTARRPRPLVVVDTPQNASVILLRSRDTALIDQVVPRVGPDQLLISVGTRRIAGAWAHLDRPINLNSALRTVDAALAALGEVSEPQVAQTPRPNVVPLMPIRTASSAPQIELTSKQLAPQNVVRMSAPSPVATRSQAAHAQKVNILVVDDNDVALKFIHARLSAFGFSVDQCRSGEEALVRVAEKNYQFVFLDVMMEGMDGFQTCKSIKTSKIAGRKAPVVVMLSSRTGTVDKVRGTFAGCDAYLMKPLDEGQLLKVLLKHDSNFSGMMTVTELSQRSVMPATSSFRGMRSPLAHA